jgi:hypothetical protein
LRDHVDYEEPILRPVVALSARGLWDVETVLFGRGEDEEFGSEYDMDWCATDTLMDGEPIRAEDGDGEYDIDPICYAELKPFMDKLMMAKLSFDAPTNNPPL